MDTLGALADVPEPGCEPRADERAKHAESEPYAPAAARALVVH